MEINTTIDTFFILTLEKVEDFIPERLSTGVDSAHPVANQPIFEIAALAALICSYTGVDNGSHGEQAE